VSLRSVSFGHICSSSCGSNDDEEDGRGKELNMYEVRINFLDW